MQHPLWFQKFKWSGAERWSGVSENRWSGAELERSAPLPPLRSLRSAPSAPLPPLRSLRSATLKSRSTAPRILNPGHSYAMKDNYVFLTEIYNRPPSTYQEMTDNNFYSDYGDGVFGLTFQNTLVWISETTDIKIFSDDNKNGQLFSLCFNNFISWPGKIWKPPLDS